MTTDTLAADTDRKERLTRLKAVVADMRNEAVRFRMMADEAACMLEELETGKPRPAPKPINDWTFVKTWGAKANS